MPRKRQSRIYWRERGGARRAYGDFRDFRDVDGGLEALIPPDEQLSTTDPDVAEQLASARVKALEQKRRTKNLLGVKRETTLAEYAAYHLEQKARSGEFTENWLEQSEHHLRIAIEFFGEGRALDTIGVEHVQQWAARLAAQPKRRPGRCPECRGKAIALADLRATCDDCRHTRIGQIY